MRDKAYLKIGIIAFVLIAGAAGGYYYYWYTHSLFGSKPVDEITVEKRSPTGNILARVVLRNAGAFSSYETLVTVTPNGPVSRAKSPVLVAACNSMRTIEVEWINSSLLRVSLPDDCMTRRENIPTGMSVEFRRISAP